MDKDFEYTIIDPINPAFIPAIRPDDVAKHQEHDQSSHGNWATGDSLPEGIGYTESEVVYHDYYGSTPEQGPYIEDYTMNAYRPINTYLRTGKFDEENDSYIKQSEVPEYRRALDNAINRTEAPRDMLLYRGTSGVDKFDTLKEGDVFTDKGYVSTTTKPDQLWDFMSTARGGRYDDPVEKSYVLQINVPKGSKVLSINKYFKGVSEAYGPTAGIREENEHLLPRGTKFRVDSIGSVDVRGGIKDKLIKVTVVTDG